jgi:short-subunit dehydrogenase
MKVLITGSSRGIGAATAKKFGEIKDTELYLVSRNEKSLKNLKNEIENKNPSVKVQVMPADLSQEDSIISLVENISGITNNLDILINNAGFLVNKDFSEFSLSDIDETFRVNYIAPSLLIKECLNLLRRSDSPHIINISSMGGIQGSAKFPGLSHYSSAKAAIAVLTECLAVEFKNEISVNCLAIGSVQTEMLEAAFPGYKAPLKPEEMADFIVEFASNAHKYMNGKIIPVSMTNP